MCDFKRRLITGIVAVALAFSLVGCTGDDSPNTTSPGGSTSTSEPVGS